MEIFFTDSGAFGSGVPDVVDEDTSARRAATFASRFVPDGMPFVLLSDGTYFAVLNRFLRALPVLGVRSARSWRAYAYDLVVWARFLDEQRGRRLVDAEVEDLRAFHVARRLSPPPFVVSAATWNRMVAALEKFYGWAWNEGLASRSPFGPGVGVGTGPARAARAKETAARNGDVKFLSLPRYAAFRDGGFHGQTSSGAVLAGGLARCAERNAAFADMVVTTGLRLQEAGSLLVCELPAVGLSDGARSAVSAHVIPLRGRDPLT